MFLIHYYKRIDCRSFFNSLPLKNRSQGDISTPYSIRIILMSTNLTFENQTVPIGSLSMSATRTPLRTISRVHQFKSNTLTRTFVLNKELSLSIWPAVNFCSKLLAFFQTGISNIVQVFHDDCSCILFNRPSHQLLRSKVEDLLCYGLFLSSQPAEQASGTRSANTSDSGFGLTNTRTFVVQGIATKVKGLSIVGVGGNKDIFNPTINPNNTSSGFKIGDLDGNAKDQIPLSINSFKFGVRPLSFRDRLGLIGEALSPDSQSSAGNIEVSLPTNRNGWFLENCQFPSVIRLGSFVSGYDMTKQGLRNLTWKIKLFSNCCVKFPRKFVGVIDNLAFKNNRRQPVSGFNVSIKDLVHPSWITKQLEFNGSDSFVHNLHNHYTTKLCDFLLFVKESSTLTQRSGRQFLPDAEDVGVSCLPAI